MRAFLAITALILSVAGPAAAAERSLLLEPSATEINFRLAATGHDVEGAFELAEGRIRFDTGTGIASGEIRIDARHAATGNAKRDRTMHQSVLETETYPFFVFRPSHLEGAVPVHGAGELQLVGTVEMHGAEHPLVLPLQVQVDGDRVEARTTFSIPFVEWGLHDPSFMFLRVAKNVDVTLTTHGTLATEGETSASAVR